MKFLLQIIGLIALFTESLYVTHVFILCSIFRDSTANKFIVCHDQLMSLFSDCPICQEPTPASIVRKIGTLVEIHQVSTKILRGFVNLNLNELYSEKQNFSI